MSKVLSIITSLPRSVYAVASGLWALFILYGLLTPGSSVPSIQIWGADKMAHAALFFVQMALLWKSVHIRGASLHRAAMYAFVLTVVFGITTELLQLTAVQRSADALDAAADAAGALLFWVLLTARTKRRHIQA